MPQLKEKFLSQLKVTMRKLNLTREQISAEFEQFQQNKDRKALEKWPEKLIKDAGLHRQAYELSGLM